MVRSNRIRSTYQRRILDWLADGGGTVTEVSQALNIRVPHASAALKKLRETGDVAKDDLSIRGSRYRLSSQGLARLESDGLARMSELVRWPPPPGAAGIVLSRDGPMLLLGYVSMPAGPLLGLPERPMDEESGVVTSSNGNEGEPESWRWAVQRGEGPVWWDMSTMRRAQPPSESSPMTLTAWMERPKVMGVVRARILDESKLWPLGVGSWFTSLPNGHWPELPQVLRDGDSVIGRAGNSGPFVSPRGGIHARIGRRIDRSLVANWTSNNALTIIDSDLLSKSESSLPFEILRHWLEIIHPRLSTSSIHDRFKRLKSDVNSGSSNALTRKVLNDFPGRNWSEEICDIIDTRYISQRGGEAVLRFALEISDKPIVIDWRWKYDSDLLGRLAGDSRCRLIICENSEIELPFKLTSAGSNGKFKLEMPGRLYLPISLSEEISVPSDWIAPTTPDEIIRGKSDSISDADNELEALWQACRLESGDDAWADRHEKQFPLASWLATTKQNQAARWRRIGELLDPIWVNLADLEDFDDKALAELALVDEGALTILIDRVRKNPLRILSKKITEPAIATAVLLSREWIDESVDVTEVWLSYPLRVSEVLRLNWDQPNIDRLVDSCPHHKLLFENINLEREWMLAIMEDVHYSLWQHQSATWLSVCLSSSLGRSALMMLDLPWPAIVYEQQLKSEDLVLVHHMPDGVGKDSLLDVLDGLTSAEEGRPPSKGRTHPYAGWLFQEKTPLPTLETNFNQEIHLALHRRFQQ